MESDEANETPAAADGDLAEAEGKEGRGAPETPKEKVRDRACYRKLAVRLTRSGVPLLLVIGLMVGAFLVRRHYFNLHTEYTTDSYYYLILARSLKSGLGYTVRGTAHIKYLPGYPLLITLFSYMFKDLSRAAGYLSILGATFSILFTYLLGKELFGEITGVLGAAILAFQPAFVQWTSLPMTEGLFTFCFVAGIYFWLTGCRKPSPYRRMGGAVLGGFTLLIRWEGALFFPLAVLVILLYWREAKLRVWEIPVILALYAVPICAFVLRNIIATGRITAYMKEYSSNKKPFTVGIFFSRVKVYAWKGLLDALMMTLFYAGAVLALIRKYKAFLVLFGWFLLFVGFHMFWYYTYERFMVPAIPAMALLAGYFFYEVGELSVMGFRLVEKRKEKIKDRIGLRPTAAVRGLAVLAVVVCIVVLAGGFAYTMYREVGRAQDIVSAHYRALADDNAGRAGPRVAAWLKANVRQGERVAADIGPDLAYEYGGTIYYVRPVPPDVPVEDADFAAPDLLDKMAARGVKYLVVANVPPPGDTDLWFPPQVPPGLVVEISDLGITRKEADRLKLVARFQEPYDFPAPHVVDVEIFEITPG